MAQQQLNRGTRRNHESIRTLAILLFCIVVALAIAKWVVPLVIGRSAGH
jgi:hypothetical protein